MLFATASEWVDGSPPPTTPAASKTSCAECPATQSWSSTRSATSRSRPKPPTCSSGSSPAATTALGALPQQQDLRLLGRSLRRRRGRRRHDRPARPAGRGRRPQRRASYRLKDETSAAPPRRALKGTDHPGGQSQVPPAVRAVDNSKARRAEHELAAISNTCAASSTRDTRRNSTRPYRANAC